MVMGNITPIVGFGGDLFQPSHKYMQLTGGVSSAELKTLVGISDLFLLHEQLLFRADIVTIRELFTAFKISELKELVSSNRIRFFKPSLSYREGTYDDFEGTILNYFSGKEYMGLADDPFDADKACQLVFDYVVPELTTETFVDFKEEMYSLFYTNELLKDREIPMDNQIGFEQGISKIRELWRAGVYSINYDWEFHWYLDICEKAAFFKRKSLAVDKGDDRSIVDDLHKFTNIPSVAELLVKSDSPTKLFLDIVNSSEADEFRGWIREINGDNIDIREAYNRRTQLLPSKDKWMDWLRFGSVQIISTVIATIVTNNPYIGFTVGTGVSAADKMFLGKVIDNSTTQYNPEGWISFIKSIK
jgi:hypothetical protein